MQELYFVFTQTATQIEPGDYDYYHASRADRPKDHFVSSQGNREENHLSSLGVDEAKVMLDRFARAYFIADPDPEATVLIDDNDWYMMRCALSNIFLGASFPYLLGEKSKERFEGLPFLGLIMHNNYNAFMTPDSVRAVAADFLNVGNSGEEKEFLDTWDANPDAAHLANSYRALRKSFLRVADNGGMMWGTTRKEML